jgi:hypothetical protein
VRIIRRHLRGERRRVSIGAVPKNYLLCQGNPDNHPCRAHGGAMDSVCTDDVEQGAESCPQPCARVSPQAMRSKREQYDGEHWVIRLVSSTAIPRRDGTPMLPSMQIWHRCSPAKSAARMGHHPCVGSTSQRARARIISRLLIQSPSTNPLCTLAAKSCRGAERKPRVARLSGGSPWGP